MNDGPAVAAELRSDLLTGHVWHVPRCPFCKRGHDYAAGGPDEPDPRRHLGARLTLCPFRARWVWLEERRRGPSSSVPPGGTGEGLDDQDARAPLASALSLPDEAER